MVDRDAMVEEQTQYLAARVAAGSLSRDSLEILAGVEHRPAQRALSRLPLVLTVPNGRVLEIERGAPANLEIWLRWGARLAPFGRALAIRAALAASETVQDRVADDERSTRAQLVGLHTGPAGAIVITDDVAKGLAPLAAVTRRASDAARACLDAPSVEAAAAVEAAWPELLRARASVELAAELAGVDWRALWVVRRLVEAAGGPVAHAGVAAGSAIAHAQSLTEDRALVTSAVRAALLEPLLGPP